MTRATSSSTRVKPRRVADMARGSNRDQFEEQIDERWICIMEQLRREISAQFDDLSIEERYRMAGMSEETIREIVAYDQQLNLAPTMTVMP